MDAMRIPYKYEVTQVLTPYLNSDGEPVYTKPKRIALMSKITLLPRSRYRSCKVKGYRGQGSPGRGFQFAKYFIYNIVCKGWQGILGVN